jgi:signal transduction histidine kinase
MVNPQYQALFPDRKLLGRPFLEALPEFQGQPFADLIRNVLETGKHFIGHEVLARHSRIQGGPLEDHYYNFTYVQVTDSDGKPYGVYDHAIDVTDRVLARKALVESEERFRLIANALPLIVWTATPDGYVDWYNDWWFNYLEMPRGTKWDDPEKQPMHPDDIPRTWARWRESLETGKPYNIEQRFRRGSDGQYRWHLVRAEAVRDSAGNIVKWAGANADIHDQKEFTVRLEQERELRERFVATLSHDLRSPLTAAKISAQLLVRKLGDPESILKLAGQIAGSLDRADQMIRDLLDANRIKAGEKLPIEIEECDLCKIASDTLADLTTVHGDRFRLQGYFSIQGYWSVSGIRRILENLCNNAIKYGGDSCPVTVSLIQESNTVQIEVHNEGTPIPLKDQESLFEPFRRTELAQAGGQKGWGLGLTLVRGIAEAQGGNVSVISDPEHGTTFRVVLPRDARSVINHSTS